MPLTDLMLSSARADLPRAVRSFIHEADRRICRFQREGGPAAFVPSDFLGAYAVLQALAAADLAPGSLFCEWGSGFGVVACLAALLDFDAYGIEIEGELVDAARELAADFDLPVEFVRGSFIPPGATGAVRSGSFAWLTPEGDAAHEELGLGPDDFDVIFAYPWPDEEGVTEELFERHAAAGAVLVTYHGSEDFRLRRKTERKRRRMNRTA